MSKNALPIPDTSVARLAIYHRTLSVLLANNEFTISSDGLGELSGVSATNVRKDLGYVASAGVRGVGYDVANLITEIGDVLGVRQNWAVVIVGIGNLGSALASYSGFLARGYSIAGLLDSDLTKVGTKVGVHVIEDLANLPAVVKERNVSIGIITTPGHAAQYVAELMVVAGIGSILNFSPGLLHLDPKIAIRNVDLTLDLQVLTYHQAHKDDVKP